MADAKELKNVQFQSSNTRNAAKKKKATEIRAAIEDYDRTLALDEISEWIEQEPLEEVITFLKEVADNLREFEFEKSLNLLKSKVF